MEAAGEVKGDAGEAICIAGVGVAPGAGDVFCGGVGGVLTDANFADLGVVCGGGIGSALGAATAEAHFHIGLTGAESDIADEDVQRAGAMVAT